MDKERDKATASAANLSNDSVVFFKISECSFFINISLSFNPAVMLPDTKRIIKTPNNIVVTRIIKKRNNLRRKVNLILSFTAKFLTSY